MGATPGGRCPARNQCGQPHTSLPQAPLTCTSCGRKNATSSGGQDCRERITYPSTAGWRPAGPAASEMASSSGNGAQTARCCSCGALALAAAGVASRGAASARFWGGRRKGRGGEGVQWTACQGVSKQQCQLQTHSYGPPLQGNMLAHLHRLLPRILRHQLLQLQLDGCRGREAPRQADSQPGRHFRPCRAHMRRPLGGRQAGCRGRQHRGGIQGVGPCRQPLRLCRAGRQGAGQALY